MGPFVKMALLAFLSGAAMGLTLPLLEPIGGELPPDMDMPPDMPPFIGLGYEAPIVNLDYELHAGSLNFTTNQYLFSNVPYAEQPVGSRRFKPSLLPTGSSDNLNQGYGVVKCVQAYPKWMVGLYAASTPDVPEDQVQAKLFDAEGQTEACLVLDVQVPVDVFEKGASAKAPVIVYIHGGGFTFQTAGSPTTLISRFGDEGVVFVSVRYRLGIYGWLAGANDAQANLGLLDQKLALQWVQKYIDRFGGDPEQVTILGQSAGAASVLHHLTANGGTGPAPPFAKAILQSPAFQINVNTTHGYELTMSTASNITGKPVHSVADLAALDEATLKKVNQQTILGAPQGWFLFGVVPDGGYVPALPQVSVSSSKFHRVPVLLGHNGLEGFPFVGKPASDKDVTDSLARLLPELKAADQAYILNTLYPAAEYPSPALRIETIVADYAMGVCSTHYLAAATGAAGASGVKAYSYLFTFASQYHGSDLPYTLFNGAINSSSDGTTIDQSGAAALQNFIAGFVAKDDPTKSTAKAAAAFPAYGPDEHVLRMGPDGYSTIKDDADNERCAWWLQAMSKGTV